MDLTTPLRRIASPALTPVAHAPIEKPLIVMTSWPKKYQPNWLNLRCTSRSSPLLRTQLKGVPEEPEDSSIVVPVMRILPSRQRSSVLNALT